MVSWVYTYLQTHPIVYVKYVSIVSYVNHISIKSFFKLKKGFKKHYKNEITNTNYLSWAESSASRSPTGMQSRYWVQLQCHLKAWLGEDSHLSSLICLCQDPIPHGSWMAAGEGPPSITTESAQNGPILFLTKYWVEFQRQQTETASHVAEACAKERTLTSSCTQNQSLTPWPFSPNPSTKQRTRT